MVEVPHIELTTAAWQRSHPGAQLRVCVDSRCDSLAHPSAVPAHLYLPAGVQPQSAVTLTASGTRAGHRLLSDRSQVRLKRVVLVKGACGAVSEWRLDVTLTPAGRLVVAS